MYSPRISQSIVIDEKTRIAIINGVRTLVHNGVVVINKYPPEDPWDTDASLIFAIKGSYNSLSFASFRVDASNAQIYLTQVSVNYDSISLVRRSIFYSITFIPTASNPRIRIYYYDGYFLNNYILTTDWLIGLNIIEYYTWYVNISWYVYRSDLFDLYINPILVDGNRGYISRYGNGNPNNVVCNNIGVSTFYSATRFNSTHILWSINFAYPSGLRNTSPVVCLLRDVFNANILYMVIKQPLNIDQVAINVYYIAPIMVRYQP